MILQRNLTQPARNIFLQALAACSVPDALDRVLRLNTGPLGPQLFVEGQPPILLTGVRTLCIIAMGKAAAPMLKAVLSRLPVLPDCNVAGILVAPQRPHNLPPQIRFFAGGHPLPNQASFDATSAALAMLRTVADLPPERTLCLFLISGGASAMMELPLDPSISLSDTIVFHQMLVHSGANIVEMNCVRKHFSAIKGGRLALAAGSARKLSLLISDVPPPQTDALGSGPTMPDPTTVDECREVIARYGLLDRFPVSVQRFFQSRDLLETPKANELDSPVITLLDSCALARAAQTEAMALGFHTVVDNTCDDWPFDRAAEYLLGRLRELRKGHPRCCVISTGEISVPVPPLDDGLSHVGGRNQHIALHAATLLRKEDAAIAVLSAGSDGIDGNSAAAGAVVDENTASGASLRQSAIKSLGAYDSARWLAEHNAAIVTGPTGHNLRDLRILLADSPQ